MILDPHSAYLPGRRKGTKIQFQKLQLLDRFPDTTAPFLHFGCTMREHYPGTLFRFPLRSVSRSQTSCRPLQRAQLGVCLLVASASLSSRLLQDRRDCARRARSSRLPTHQQL